MKLIPTFYNGTFYGFEDMKTIVRLRKEVHELALAKQKSEKADHMVYGFFDIDNDGNITTARLYDGIAKADNEFEEVATISNAHIYAIHARR